MEFPALQAVSPIDGRYRKTVAPLENYFSEAAIIRYRLWVEVEYFLALAGTEIPSLASLPRETHASLRALYQSFTLDMALEIKDIEKETNHDIKAVEVFLRRQFDRLGLSPFKEFIHFGLTSQDINNTAFPMALRDAFITLIKPGMESIQHLIQDMAHQWKEVPMLARTHGQPATPTLLGKEMMVFAERLQQQIASFNHLPFSGKFGGATGNLNAHYIAYPEIDWMSFSGRFLQEQLGLNRQHNTTQIEHYDGMAAFFDACRRINTIFIDFCRDMWAYISMEYFRQQVVAGEVGSSTMPHKVNPIDFENAEGNLGVANALFSHLSEKLPVSRLQRDLTDSTVIRNIGVPLAHSLIAFHSMTRGIGKLRVQEHKMLADLTENWAILGEAIQTILRREGFPDPYQALKTLTRGKENIQREDLHQFIDSLDITNDVKQELKGLTPQAYTGKISF